MVCLSPRRSLRQEQERHPVLFANLKEARLEARGFVGSGKENDFIGAEDVK